MPCSAENYRSRERACYGKEAKESNAGDANLVLNGERGGSRPRRQGDLSLTQVKRWLKPLAGVGYYLCSVPGTRALAPEEMQA